MKKLFIAIAAFFYLAISTGLVFNMHYCMGELAGVNISIAPSDEATCKCGSGDKAMDCCKTESKLVKVDQDQQHSPAQLFHFAPHEALLAVFTLRIVSEPVVEQAKGSVLCNGPPDTPAAPIYLRNNVFRL